MENSVVEASGWHLQICLLDKVNHTPFASRPEAIEHAQMLIREFGPFVGITICSPCGTLESLQKSTAKVYAKVRTVRCYR